MDIPQENIEMVRRYLEALERGATGEVLAAFFTPDVVQHEFPNRLVPNGAVRNLDDLLDGAMRGQQVMASQRFEIVNTIASGNQVALEVRLRGTAKIRIGSLSEGEEMRANFGVFIELWDGRIAAQRNYDCFEPW